MNPVINSLFLKRFKYDWAAEKYAANLLERENCANLIFKTLVHFDTSGYYNSLVTEKQDDQLSNLFNTL